MRSIAVVLAVVLLLAPVTLPQAAPLEPLAVDWEQHFTLEWEPGERAGRPVIRGRVVNESPHSVTGIRLLVDGLDASGGIAAQRVSWVPGGTLTPWTGRVFEVPAPGTYRQYRVRVFAYDRLEGGGADAGFL